MTPTLCWGFKAVLSHPFVDVQCCIPGNIPIFIPDSTLSSRAMCTISNTALGSSASLSFFYPRVCFPSCASSPLPSHNHLPATLLASFIKRLSRLCLFAPPAAIVMTIPFTYNILKLHPACMAMIHGDSQGFQSGLFSRDAVLLYHSSCWNFRSVRGTGTLSLHHKCTVINPRT